MRPETFAIPIAFPALGASKVAIGGFSALVGWALCESTGAAGAKLNLRDGQAAAADLRLPVTLLAGESTRDFPPRASWLMFESGVFIDWVSGAIDVVLYVIPGERLQLWETMFTDSGIAVMGGPV